VNPQKLPIILPEMQIGETSKNDFGRGGFTGP